MLSEHLTLYSERLMRADQAEQVRQRILSRCPILKHAAAASVDGRIQGEWFQASVVEQALRVLRRERLPHEAQRFTPEFLRDKLAEIDRTPFTAEGAAAEIVLVEIAPKRLFSYWSIPDSAVALARVQMGEAARGAIPVLRFYDVTAGDFAASASHFDLEVVAAEPQRYVDLWAADRSYQVEIGLRAQDGWFVPLARSGRVHAPRDRAGDGLANLCNVRRNAGSILRPPVPRLFVPKLSPSVQLPGDLDWATRDLFAETETRRLYTNFLSEGARALRGSEPIRRPDFPALKQAYAARATKASQPVTARAERPATRKADSALIAVRLDAPVAKRERPTPAPQLPSLPPRGRLNLQEMGRLEREQTISQLAMLAMREPRKRLSPLALPQPAERLETPGKKSKTRTFRLNRVSTFLEELQQSSLELEAELVLRGKVKPGKKVRIGGEVIATEPDGSFSVRCIVKDGKLHVPVEVVEAELVTERREVRVDLG